MGPSRLHPRFATLMGGIVDPASLISFKDCVLQLTGTNRSLVQVPNCLKIASFSKIKVLGEMDIRSAAVVAVGGVATSRKSKKLFSNLLSF